MSTGIHSVPAESDRLDLDHPTSKDRLQRVGGVAAVLQTGLYLVAFIFILGIWPRYGVQGPADASNPALVLPAIATAPSLMVFAVLNVPSASCLLLLVLALAARLQSGSLLHRLALTTGLISAACFLVLGMIRFLGWPQLATLYLVDQPAGAAAYTAVQALDSGIDGAALFTLGGWILMTS